MIAVCGDQRPIRVRATSGYLGGAVPVLSRRDQPQHPAAALPVGHERRGVGGHRAALPAPGWKRGQGGRAVFCRRDIVNGIRYLIQGPVGGRCPLTSATGAPCMAMPGLAGQRRHPACTMSCESRAGGPAAPGPPPR